MIRIRLLFPPMLLALLVSTPASAQNEAREDERWFQTEIIVFEIREKNATDSQEIWPDDPGLPDYEGSIELTPVVDPAITVENEGALTADESGATTTAPAEAELPVIVTDEGVSATVPRQAVREHPFQRLPDEALTLTEIAEKLSDSQDYVPILHIAWRQPVAAKDKARAIYISSQQDESTPELSTINELISPPSDDETALPLVVVQNETGENRGERALNTIDGILKLHLGRYLHVEADLLYRSQTEPQENNTFFMTLDESEQPQTLFRMHQKRRMRSGELHYFDHPMFGLLVKIIPYELPEPEVETEEAETADPQLTDQNSGI